MCCTPVLYVQSSADLAAVMSLLPACLPESWGQGDCAQAPGTAGLAAECAGLPRLQHPHALCPHLISTDTGQLMMIPSLLWWGLTWPIMRKHSLIFTNRKWSLCGIFRKKGARPPKMQLIPDFLPRRHTKPYQARQQQQLQKEHLREDLVLTHLFLRPVKGPERTLKFRYYPWPDPSRMEAGGGRRKPLHCSQCWHCCWAGQAKPTSAWQTDHTAKAGKEDAHSTARSCPSCWSPHFCHIRQQQTTSWLQAFHPSEPQLSLVMTQYYVWWSLFPLRACTP